MSGSRRQAVLAGLLATAMAVALLPSIGLSVVASSALGDLGMTRADLGLAIAVVSGVTAVASVTAGGWTDRHGGRLALIAVFGLGGLSLAGIVVSPGFLLLAGAMVIAGLCSSLTNPATNRLIIETVRPGERGLITGVKQSGEMFTFLLAGVLLPVMALSIGWRATMASLILIPAIAVVVLVLVVPRPPPIGRGTTATAGMPTRAPLPSGTLWLALFMLLNGTAGGALSTYLPLYSEEAVGIGAELAGLTFAVIGVSAFVGRIAWGYAAGRWERFGIPLMAIALLSLVAALLIWSASVVDAALLWLGSALWGASLLSAAAVAMMAVINLSAATSAGRASGAVLVGFSIGLMLGPPVFGFAIDLTGSYDLGFAMVVMDLLLAVVVGWLWATRERGPSGPTVGQAHGA